MAASLPRLADYDVLPTGGFLPDTLPVRRLPQACYAPWEDIVAELPALILTRRLRPMVDALDVLSLEELVEEPHWRRAYTVLGFLAHAYVWGVDGAVGKLPKSIAEPWIGVSTHLGLPPVATYAGLVLWNFREIVPSASPPQLPLEWDWDNLTTINTFTGLVDESWFYLVSVYFEHAGAHCMSEGLAAIEAARREDTRGVVAHLQTLAESLDRLGLVMMRMEEMCDPHVFFFRIRPFLAGWKGMELVGLSDGVVYGDEKTPRVYSGGLNAQLSLIQALDILLGIEHHATGQRPMGPRQGALAAAGPPSAPLGFLAEQRKYMPAKHTQFLEHLERVANLRAYVGTHGSREAELTLLYDACLAMLKAFRDKHIQIVTRYVVMPLKKNSASSTLRTGLAKSGGGVTGTGGTSLLPFLKQCRDETGDPAAGRWGQRILSDGPVKLARGVKNMGLEDEPVKHW